METARSGKYGKVSIASTATLVCAKDDNRTNIIIYNEGTVDCRIGTDSSVTNGGAADGILLQVGAALSLDNFSDIYAITAAGTGTISYIANKII